jgi:hypothetical protein
MTAQDKDRIECAIRHIKTAVDVDQWAVEIAVEAMKKQIAMKIKEIHVDEYFCPSCGEEQSCDQSKVYHKFCPSCGQRIIDEREHDELDW